MDDRILLTERCRLRKLSHDDAPHIVSACKTPGFNDGMRWEPVKTIEETREFTDAALEDWEKGTQFVWTIEDKNDGTFIGRMGMTKQDGEPTEAFELGYWIHPSQQGKGYATEAAQEVIRYTFEELNIPSIIASRHEWNEASGRVLEKIGMKHVGFSEDKKMKDGKLIRSVEYLLKKSEWEG